jgi:hypothetical protein
MVNYNNGKIYKIEAMNAPVGEKIYIGSTTKQYLSQRMDKHRSEYKNWKNGKAGKVMAYDLFDKYGVENCRIVLIELVNANSKDELLSREAYYIKNTEQKFNRIIPIQTIDERKEYKKNYYADNKEKFIEKSKDYYASNVQKIKETHERYRFKNNYKCQCDCGSIYTKSNEIKHLKCKKHIDFAKINN